MMRVSKYIALVLLLSVCISTAQAGDAGRETPFAIGAGARPLGMGGGFVSMADDATSLYYNPSGLSSLEFQEFAAMHTVLLEGSIYDVVSWVYPIGDHHGLGIGIMRLGTEDITRRVDYLDRGAFHYAYSQSLLSYGRSLGNRFAIGTSLKILRQSLAGHTDFGIGLDLGLTAKIHRHLALGVMARDIRAPELQLQATSERTPVSVVGGLSLSDLAVSEYVQLTAAVDLEKTEDRDLKVRAGAEIDFHRSFALRLGYDRDNVSFGAGLKYRRLKVDYAYKLVDYVSDIHHFSLSFLIGNSVSEQIRLKEIAALPPEPTEEEKQFAALMEQGNLYLHRFHLDSATYFFSEALKYQPDNREIIGSIAAIEEARRKQREQETLLFEAQEELNQTLGGFLTQAGQLYAQRHYRASLDLLELIFDIDPDNYRAQQLQRQIRQSMSDEIAANFETARQAWEAGRLVEAIEAYNRILDVDPDNEGASQSKQQVLATMGLPEKIRLGIEMFEKGRYEAAKTQFRAILDVNPNEATALDYLNRIQEAQTRTATLEDLQNDAEIWSLYLDGLRFMRNKEYQQAIEAWQKVLAKYPNNPNTLNNIEQARLRMGAQDSDN
ncbi:MAG: PorV/PorQ family protein [bacterium]|nr:PorV/PorQ family protein [bacterium]